MRLSTCLRACSSGSCRLRLSLRTGYEGCHREYAQRCAGTARQMATAFTRGKVSRRPGICGLLSPDRTSYQMSRRHEPLKVALTERALSHGRLCLSASRSVTTVSNFLRPLSARNVDVYIKPNRRGRGIVFLSVERYQSLKISTGYVSFNWRATNMNRYAVAILLVFATSLSVGAADTQSGQSSAKEPSYPPRLAVVMELI